MSDLILILFFAIIFDSAIRRTFLKIKIKDEKKKKELVNDSKNTKK